VTHKQDGYKAAPFEAQGLAEGVEWVTGEADYQQLVLNARDKITSTFDSPVIARQYQALYQEMLA